MAEVVEEMSAITSVDFRNYKGFSHYSLSLRELNILVGPNNCGKSTVIGAFRVLAAGIKKARRRKPERIVVGDDVLIGYRIAEEELAISTENVHTDYSEADTSILFRLSNGNKLRALFPREGGCALIPEPERSFVRSPASFNSTFPLNLKVVPVLGPLEHDEPVVEPETVQRNLHTHLASRHFRNFWIYYPDEFEVFADLVARTWPGMEIERPERLGRVVRMFCRENRMTRELYWSGFGFQIWCQLLTHICTADEDSIVIIDEPEIYLHPDVQRQLLGILRSFGGTVLIATHSTEIMSDADPNEIVMIEKHERAAVRLKELTDIQFALDQVGSVQNITLTRLAKDRRVVFVEGGDYAILAKLARSMGLDALASGVGVTALPCGGFAGWRRVRDVAWGINQTLGTPFLIGAIFDRDYFPDEEIADVENALREQRLSFVHIHECKEIENYLLVPTVISRALRNVAREGNVDQENVPTPEDIIRLLDQITLDMKPDVTAQHVAKRLDYARSTSRSRDKASTTREALQRIESRWSEMDQRLKLVSGKEVLRRLREIVQAKFGITLTVQRLTAAFHKREIPADLRDLLTTLDTFRQSAPPDVRRRVKGAAPPDSGHTSDHTGTKL